MKTTKQIKEKEFDTVKTFRRNKGKNIKRYLWHGLTLNPGILTPTKVESFSKIKACAQSDKQGESHPLLITQILRATKFEAGVAVKAK